MANWRQVEDSVLYQPRDDGRRLGCGLRMAPESLALTDTDGVRCSSS